MEIPKKFLKGYEHKETEKEIYDAWEKSNLFNPEECIKQGVTEENADSFSIVLPPPNVTGRLHVGHSIMLAIEDIIVRFKRMRGLRTLWVPGTDHAAIATQSKYEKELYKKEKKSRHDFPRDEFVQKVNEFALDNQSQILDQLRSMGASLDWSRLAFTLDEKRENAVRTAFKQMYDDGLIYRGDRIVNWDPKGQTTISDDEIVRKEETTKFYYFKYGPFTIGTARPETKFADKYIVVHPDDERYSMYEHGQEFEIEWINGPITATLIKDETADMEMGTGAMTITPWHSRVDFELAEKYDLPKVQIINKYGKLLPIAGEFEGMKIKDAREKIVEKLDGKGLLVKVDENYTHHLATAERTGGIVEPQIMRQWFIDVNKKFTVENSKVKGVENGNEYSLKDLMHLAGKAITTLPERYARVYDHWIDNLHDWCISRQIMYGHQIPVWYRTSKETNEEEVYVGVENPEGEGWEQDPDTLDTWFSSGLWTFSTLGWPDETEDLKIYHPTSLIETGYDIIFFWNARMILMATYLLGEVPFETMYFHGLVRDKHGRKMSKSLGNVVEPNQYIEQYGADALRMALIIGVGPGSDSNLDENNVRGYRKFANKIWNMARFILENTKEGYTHTKTPPALTNEQETYLKECDRLIKDITSDLEEYRFHLAGEKIYHYTWHTLADEIIEKEKDTLKEGSEDEQHASTWILIELFSRCLKCLHPFMPYVTEEIWKHMPSQEKEFLMVEKWPEA